MLILAKQIKFFSNIIKTTFFGVLMLMLISSISVFSATNYKAKIAETERQAQKLAKEVAAINDNIHDLRKRQGTLKEEIVKIKEEGKNFTDISVQARSLALQYESQKQDLENEIVKLQDDTKKIYKELQKQNLSQPIKSLFTAKNLGEAIGKIYANSNLEQKARQILEETKFKVIEKQTAIDNQKQTANRADIAEKQAKEKQLEAEKLLEETKGDEAKYKEIADQRNKEIDEAQKLKEKYAKAEKEEQDRIKKEIEEAQKRAKEQARLDALTKSIPTFIGSTNNYNKTNTNFEINDYSGKCRFESTSSLGVGKGYFTRPTSGNFEREFGFCNHDGIDISNSTGTPIYAAAAGKVARGTYTSDGYGNNIVLVHTVAGKTVYTLYGHLSRLLVSTGDTVTAGQEIGKMGSTGNSTGPHLHFMIISGDNYDGPSCRYGGSKCYKPRDYINF